MNWWNLSLLGLVVVGHTELWVVVINRLHAIPFPRRLLKVTRYVHFLAMAAFPVLLVWSVGLHGPCLLKYGDWQNLSPPWLATLAVCGVGVLSFVASVARYQLRVDSPAVLSAHAEIIDIAQQLGAQPVARGPHYRLAKLPGNEQFTVEFAEKRLALPRLPAEWHGLRILQLSDWHLLPTIERSFFEAVVEHALAKPADLIVFTGDLVDDLDCLEWLPQTIARCDARLGRYFILGNHDWALDADVIRRAMTEQGWQSVGGRTFSIEYKGRRLIVGGDETPWLGRAPDFTAASPDDFRLLLSHTPDHFRRAQAAGVDLMLSGHNHGGQVVLPMIGPVYAPSRFGVRYASGTFATVPTVMHVSRGLAGCHPLRWRALPEVTWLVLEREQETV